MRDFDKQMEMVLYHSDEGDVSVDAYIKDESIWITQKAMAELFGVKVPDISKHLSNIYDEGELVKEATISKMEIVQREGNRDVKRTPVFYNLDAIISVGYRVNSIKATKFRVQSEPVNGVSGSRLQIFLLSVALITQRIPKWLIIFMQRYRTSFIMRSQIIPLQR